MSGEKSVALCTICEITDNAAIFMGGPRSLKAAQHFKCFVFMLSVIVGALFSASPYLPSQHGGRTVFCGRTDPAHTDVNTEKYLARQFWCSTKIRRVRKMLERRLLLVSCKDKHTEGVQESYTYFTPRNWKDVWLRSDGPYLTRRLRGS